MKNGTYDIPVTVMLPGPTYGRLSAVARKHETTVGELAAELVRRALIVAAAPQEAPQRPAHVTKAQKVIQTREEKAQARLERDERIRELHATGASDGAIAAHLGITGGRVNQLRNALGLPANFHGKTILAEAAK